MMGFRRVGSAMDSAKDSGKASAERMTKIVENNRSNSKSRRQLENNEAYVSGQSFQGTYTIDSADARPIERFAASTAKKNIKNRPVNNHQVDVGTV